MEYSSILLNISIVIIAVLLFFGFTMYVKYYFRSLEKRLKSPVYLVIVVSGFIFAGFVLFASPWTPLVELIWGIINKRLLGNAMNLDIDKKFNKWIFGIYTFSLTSMVISFFATSGKKVNIFSKDREWISKDTTSSIEENEILNKRSNLIFYERIRLYFETKNKGLILEHDEELKVLYGQCKMGFFEYKFVINYNSEKRKKKSVEYNETSITDAKLKCETFYKSNFPKKLKDENFRVEFYYIVEEGFFQKEVAEIICLTEREVINSLINFDFYFEDIDDQFTKRPIPYTANKNLTLKEVFIPPTYNNNQGDLSLYLDKWLYEDSDRHIVLLGDFGTGKTSFMKYYAHKLINDYKENKRNARIPILIPLKGRSPVHLGIKDAIGGFLINNKIDTNLETLDILIERGKLVFLLDGFDELGFIGTNNQKIRQFQEIWRLAVKGNKVLVSGRKSYFVNDYVQRNALLARNDSNGVILPTNGPYSEIVELDFFNGKTIVQLIKKYYSNKQEWKKYYEFIDNRNDLADLCKRPQFLHIVCEILPNIYSKTKNEAEIYTQSLLMEKFVDYSINRQLDKNIVSVLLEGDVTKKDFLISFFSDLAAKVFLSNENHISSFELVEFINKKIENLQLRGKEQIEGVQSELRTAYFVEREGDKFLFKHKPILEYFTSLKIIDLISKKRFEEKIVYEKDWPVEILSFVKEKYKAESDQPSNTNSLSLLDYVSNNKVSSLFKVTYFRLLGVLASFGELLSGIMINWVSILVTIFERILVEVNDFFRTIFLIVLLAMPLLFFAVLFHYVIISYIFYICLNVFLGFLIGALIISYINQNKRNNHWLEVSVSVIDGFRGIGLYIPIAALICLFVYSLIWFNFVRGIIGLAAGMFSLTTILLLMKYLMNDKKIKFYSKIVQFNSLFDNGAGKNFDYVIYQGLNVFYDKRAYDVVNLRSNRRFGLFSLKDVALKNSSIKTFAISLKNNYLENAIFSGRIIEFLMSECELKNVNFDSLSVFSENTFELYIKLDEHRIDPTTLRSLCSFLCKLPEYKLRGVSKWLVQETRKYKIENIQQ